MSRSTYSPTYDRTDDDEDDDDDGDYTGSGAIPRTFGGRCEVGTAVGGVGGVGVESAGVASCASGCGVKLVGCVGYGGRCGATGTTFFEEVDVVAFLYYMNGWNHRRWVPRKGTIIAPRVQVDKIQRERGEK